MYMSLFTLIHCCYIFAVVNILITVINFCYCYSHRAIEKYCLMPQLSFW